jgi:hypothetical protein
MEQLFELLTTFGLPTVLVIWLIHNWHKREKAQDDKLTDLEKFCREELLTCTKECTAVNVECTKAMQSNTDMMSQTCIILEKIKGADNG